MERRPTAKATSQTPIIVQPTNDDLTGVANLLAIARNSVRLQCADSICIGHLTKCISHLVTRYGVPRPVVADGSVVGWEAILRMLRYAQVELTQNLIDADCVDLLDLCIGRFACIQSAREDDSHAVAVN
jgi:hypothetical protein